MLLDGEYAAIHVSSGKRRENLSDLRRRFRQVSVDHAEGHAAAELRSSGAQKADLVINNDPCRTCDSFLKMMLPRGVELNLYVRGADGTVQPYDTYVGTGEAIQQ